MSDDRHDIDFLKVEGIRKVYGRQAVLKDIDFRARSGEFICVLGPSGCGKTTLLRVIAGLEPLDAGRILVEGKDISREPVFKRNIGIVFQSYALFPNLTADQNIAYGLVSQKLDKKTIRKRVTELLELVGLENLGNRYPAQLSGGQQQRVALARAIAPSPRLLLLDEPLSALDSQVRLMLRGEIRRLQQQLKITTMMVTHDQEEALSMGDRILVMNEGKIVQDDPPAQIYDHPATPFVAAFVGSMNFLVDAVRIDAGLYQYGRYRLRVNGDDGKSAGSSVVIGIRPEDVRIGRTDGSSANVLMARVQTLSYRGSNFRVQFGVASETEERFLLEADVPSDTVRRYSLYPDRMLNLHLPAERLRVYDAALDCSLCRNTA
ncbi:MAG: ATP-binding cassette domain-containing protein [Thermodesulfobacteriota bacterium]